MGDEICPRETKDEHSSKNVCAIAVSGFAAFA